MSRNNWSATIPTSYAVISMTTALQNDLLAQDNPSNIEKSDVAYPTYGAQNGLMLIDLKQDSEGNKIPYEAQIIRVADEYDAIVSKRQYKSHVGISDTIKTI